MAADCRDRRDRRDRREIEWSLRRDLGKDDGVWVDGGTLMGCGSALREPSRSMLTKLHSIFTSLFRPTIRPRSSWSRHACSALLSKNRSCRGGASGREASRCRLVSTRSTASSPPTTAPTSLHHRPTRTALMTSDLSKLHSNPSTPLLHLLLLRPLRRHQQPAVDPPMNDPQHQGRVATSVVSPVLHPDQPTSSHPSSTRSSESCAAHGVQTI